MSVQNKNSTEDIKPEIVEEEIQAITHTRNTRIAQQNAELYAEALEKYGVDGDIDPIAEKRLKRKLDRRIIPALGICYFFYVSYSPNPTNTSTSTKRPSPTPHYPQLNRT